jgi:hypothetical protein
MLDTGIRSKHQVSQVPWADRKLCVCTETGSAGQSWKLDAEVLRVHPRRQGMQGGWLNDDLYCGTRKGWLLQLLSMPVCAVVYLVIVVCWVAIQQAAL